jgi:hypothetical protein
MQQPLLLAHGMLAILGTYVLGVVSARHVVARWMEGSRRLSGGTLAVLLAALSLSGFALFFVSDDLWQRLAKLVHEVLGVGITLFALQHWFVGRRVRSSKEASRPSEDSPAA